MNHNYYKLFRSFFLMLLIFEIAGLLGLTAFNPRLGLADIKPQFSWLGLILTLLASWGALELVHRYFKSRYQSPPPFYLWFLTAFAVAFDFIADINHFFVRFTHFDKLAHFLNGGVIVGFFSFWIIRQINRRNVPSWSPAIVIYLVISFVVAGGFLYEVLEYSIDWALGTGNLVDRWDTSEDMIFNFLGAASLTIPFLLGIL